MIITLAGTPGSGKSTIAKMIVKKLGLKRYYMGRIMRNLARKKGITLNELDDLRKTDKSFDKEVDDYFIDLVKSEDDFVLETRTAAYFFKDDPKVVNIFLYSDLHVSSERIYNDIVEKDRGDVRNEQVAKSIDEQEVLIKKRIDDEQEIYKNLYGFDLYDKDMYDLWLDTSHMTPEAVFDNIVKFVKDRK